MHIDVTCLNYVGSTTMVPRPDESQGDLSASGHSQLMILVYSSNNDVVVMAPTDGERERERVSVCVCLGVKPLRGVASAYPR